jgi:hypothetical protein
MSRLRAIQIEVRERDLGPSAPRGAFGLALMIICAVAAVSFTVGLTR